MTWVKTQDVFINKPFDTSHDSCPSHGAGQLDGLASRLTFEYHNQTAWYLFYKYKNYCHRNKIYVLASLLEHLYLQPTVCARIYCIVNTACHSCCHHREFTSWRTHARQCCYCGFEMTSQLLTLTLNDRTSHRPSNDAIWDLRHDLRRELTESRWFSFVNTTWLVRVQAKAWVKSQVKTVSEYGPWPLMLVHIYNLFYDKNTYRHVITLSYHESHIASIYRRLDCWSNCLFRPTA